MGLRAEKGVGPVLLLLLLLLLLLVGSAFCCGAGVATDGIRVAGSCWGLAFRCWCIS